MLNSFAVKRFKSLADVSLTFAPITVFIGGNSTGKSSVLQALSVLKQSREDTGANLGLAPSGTSVELGSFEDIAHQHHADAVLEFGLDLSLERLTKRDELWYSCSHEQTTAVRRTVGYHRTVVAA